MASSPYLIDSRGKPVGICRNQLFCGYTIVGVSRNAILAAAGVKKHLNNVDNTVEARRSQFNL
jgi:hypothetical protein